MRGIQTGLFGAFLSVIFLFCTAAPSPRDIDIHISIDNEKLDLSGPEEPRTILNFDSLKGGQRPNSYGGLEWADSFQVVDAPLFASSEPMAALTPQYNIDGALTHPSFQVGKASPARFFTLYSFFISPAYEPRILPPIKFNVTVIGFGAKEGQAVARLYTVGGGRTVYPVKINVTGIEWATKVEISITSQIAPVGAPFQPLYFIDDVEIGWRGGRVPGSGYGGGAEGGDVWEL